MRALPYACALPVMGFFGAVLVWIAATQPERSWWAAGDLAVGIGGLVVLRARHRAPVAVALLTAAAVLVSTTVIGPAFVAYVSLTKHRGWSRIVPAALLLWATNAVYSSGDGLTQQLILAISTMTLSIIALTVAGLYLRSRHDLAAERAERQAEEERRQLQQLEQVRMNERARIAREMHDVLAHRISLLALHAGALAHRTDLSPEEVRAAATVIHESAQQSLSELRATLGSLRESSSTARPQPSWAELPALLDEIREAGQIVVVNNEVADAAQLPAQIGRHAYRIVQEALTNARKHAPGARVELVMRGRPGEPLHLRISNAMTLARTERLSGGLGLIGLTERVNMVSGTMANGVENGQFVLDATMPWEVPA